MIINNQINVSSLQPAIQKLFESSAKKIKSIERSWDLSKGTPVYTVDGQYATRGWTEWTRGFQYGSSILQFDATNDNDFLSIGKKETVAHMASHVSHIGVHDHGFNNISTYGNLLRLMNEGKITENEWERNFYELALKLSGAVQASRWSNISDGLGYIYSFNGPHSLFSDTIRTVRTLAIAHQLGHVLMGENDEKINLLERLLLHAEATTTYNVYFGKGRDGYDVRGRVVHESIFDMNNGAYRSPSTQQGYSPFTTWTRGQAWVLTGYAEELEFLNTLNDYDFEKLDVPNMKTKDEAITRFLETALAAAEFYINETPTDGIPYWDTGAPELHKLGDWKSKLSDPYNDYEPVDSSAAAIAAQGLLRLGKIMDSSNPQEAERYFKAGLTVAENLFKEPYLSTDTNHQGLILHSVYHQPNRWDNVPKGRKVACDEATMWGDYHARELALYIKRIASDEPYYKFYLD
ncbi:MAG: hypothetical protein L3J41_04645 [Melioribacteraceae bacterium]|nr:hypothetical protein [Melioribacteraceae bacterium]